jgi:Na+-transporting methylmalonyl-CoA/oxaloacetate decarboxylase beta subunit
MPHGKEKQKEGKIKSFPLSNMSLVTKIPFLVIIILLVMMMTLPSAHVKNSNAMIKGLMKQVGSRDELL